MLNEFGLTASAISYENGNALSYADYGEKDGFPILVQHGMVASIRAFHLFDRLVAADKRVICIARPGYGDSSPYRMKNIGAWGRIVALLVEALELPQFDVLGLSSGAPYSYAVGYSMPERVRNIYIFSGTPALYDPQVQAHWPYPLQQDATIEQMQLVAKEVFFPHVTKEDLARDEVKDSMANGCFGIAQDLRLRGMDWGFALSDLRARVIMEHSREDGSVPFATAELTAQMLPDCTLLAREGEHFSGELLDAFIRNIMLRQ
jgi:pimeloyl-ACP methyl ester carboxylesterase